MTPIDTALSVLRSAGYDVYEPSDEELDALSHMIGEMKRRHKAEKCRNGMTNEPPCRPLEEAMRDIRRRAETCQGMLDAIEGELAARQMGG